MTESAKTENLSPAHRALLERVAAVEAERRAKGDIVPQAEPEKPKAKVVQLPLWPEAVRGTPNVLARSALFAAIQGKERRPLKQDLIGAIDGLAIRMTGWQLDQLDFDVWAQLVHLARLHPLGNVCEFKGYAFLKAIGRSNQKANYLLLDASLDRLAAAGVSVGNKGSKIFTGSLVQKAWRDEETKRYKVVLEQDMLKLFGASNWTGLDWEERLKLKNRPLAQWLYNHYSTHAKPFPMKVETLHAMCGSTNKSMRDFKRQAKEAFAFIEAQGITMSATIDDLVTVERAPTKAQQKHLSSKARKKRADG